MIAVIVVGAVCGVASAGVVQADDTVGVLGHSDILSTPGLSADQIETMIAKDIRAQENDMELLDAGIMADRTVSSITQVAQSTSYYCGPAALVSLVKADGDSISQATAAS